jgi:lysine 2,3-aminomutase
VLPQRITPDLCDLIRRYHPVWVNTHFNHPKEITAEAAAACARLADAGIPLGNQTVLLRGINDCPVVMRRLMHALLQIRVRPYYIYQCDLTRGIAHFRTPVATGIEIMELLRGHTSGLAVPTYVIDAPGGGGKIPVGPNYVLAMGDGQVILRNYEGVIARYTEPKRAMTDGASQGGLNADGICPICGTRHEDLGTGLGMLFSGQADSLEPRGLARATRRDGHQYRG